VISSKIEKKSIDLVFPINLVALVFIVELVKLVALID
jgi:hypothetical protein